jgi:hypothetical protein
VFQRIGKLPHQGNRTPTEALLQGELSEESVRKLAAELFAHMIAIMDDEVSPVPQTASAIPEAAKGSLLYEALVFAALAVITQAQKRCTEAQLRQLCDELSFMFSLLLCSLGADDSSSHRSKVRADYDRYLLQRYGQRYCNLRVRWLWGKVWLAEGIASALLGERPHSQSESFLLACLRNQLSKVDVSVPTSVLPPLARAIVAETEKITSVFFDKTGTAL